MTAEQFLASRFKALADADYLAVYAGYHVDAPFLQQFPDSAGYCQFAEQQLSGIVVNRWSSLRQRQLADGSEEHLLLMELSVDGVSQYFYELALLIETAEGWRYHSAQKLGGDDYSGAPEQINFSHFDQVSPKIRY